MPSWEHALVKRASDTGADFLAKFFRNMLCCGVRNCTSPGQGHKSSLFFFSPTHWSKEGLAAYWSSRDHFSFKCFWCLKLFAGYTPHCKQPALPCKALPLLHLSCTEAILSTGFYGKGIYLVHLSGLPAVLSPFSSSTASGLVCHHNPGTTQPAFWLYSCNSPLESL